MIGNERDEVAKRTDAVAEMAKAWALVADLMGGTAAMRAAGPRHLPQWPGEGADAFKARLATATLFPAYARTVSVLTGKPFSKPLAYSDDVPERIKGWADNIDLEGRNLHAFAADLCADALGYGLCGILVDCPVATDVRTVADEKRIGLRPYFVHVKHDAILGWRTAKVGGNVVLTQLRLMESVAEPKGKFGVQQVAQVRVLEPGRWETYRKTRGADGLEAWTPHENGVTSIDVIPFVPVYGFRRAHMIGTPPMIELAHMNVEHWQSKSDQQTILHVARVPVLFAKDIGSETPLVVGAGTFVKASSSEADLKYVEHSGAAIEAGRKSILDLEDRMRQVGAELLVIKPGNITEVQTRSDNEPGMCDLQRIMQALEDSLDQALDLMARYVGEATGGHVDIYDDFGVATLAEASAQLLFSMKVDGSISHETLLNEMKRRGVLNPDVDVKKEIEAAVAEKKAAGEAIERRENLNI